MKLLVLDEEFPYPLNSGNRIRSFNLMRRLALNHEVRYLAYGKNGSDGYQALKEASIHPMAVNHQIPPKSGPLFYLRLLSNLFSQWPYIVTSHHSAAFEQALERCLRDDPPDLILCAWSPYAIFLKNLDSVIRVIGSVNIESQIWWRYYENESNAMKRWYIGRQAAKVERFERLAFQWSEGATAVTRQEADVIASYDSSLKVDVIDNGVDLEYFSGSGKGATESHLVFTGSMDWRPNQDAAVWFASNIFPGLKRDIPDLQATFVGRQPPRHVTELGNIDGIAVTGTVADVRPYLQDASVYIVPLRVGGGSRLKILEALAMGKAVVSTSIGAEGLEVVDGKHLLLADGAQDFAAAVKRLLSDKALADRLGAAGRTMVQERYGWDRLAEKLERFLLQLVETK